MPIRKTKEIAGGRRVMLSLGNLLDEPVDAIVNAANSHLAHGGGVAAAIARAAGQALEDDGDALVRREGLVPVGSAVVTVAGQLPFQGVIHAVGPSQGQGNEEEKLASAVCSALDRANERSWRSIAMPAISSGIFSVPIRTCARAYVTGIARHFERQPDSTLREVRITLFAGAHGGDLMHYVDEEMERFGSTD